MQDYLGDGIYVDYHKNTDDIEISTTRYTDRHYIFFSREEYEALKRFAQRIGWENTEAGSSNG